MASKTWHFDNFTGMHTAVMAAEGKLREQGFQTGQVFNESRQAWLHTVSDHSGSPVATLTAKNVGSGGELLLSATSAAARLVERVMTQEAIAMGGRNSQNRW